MAKESNTSKQNRAVSIFNILKKKNPEVATFLDHKNTFELLIAVILSAQCTDERVNMVTPELFKSFPTPLSFKNGSVDEIREKIKSINFCNNKAINIKKTGQIICDKYNNKVPDTLKDLVMLPGVGRKTANVVLGQAFNKPGITVDTHVKRLTKRMGFTVANDPVKIEMDCQKVWPEEIWSDFSTHLIIHGRTICPARKPRCEECDVADFCLKRL